VKKINLSQYCPLKSKNSWYQNAKYSNIKKLFGEFSCFSDLVATIKSNNVSQNKHTHFSQRGNYNFRIKTPDQSQLF